MPRLEDVQMLGQRQHRLHHVQVVHRAGVELEPVRFARKSACFWLLPSRQTRSPGSITACSKASICAGIDDLAARRALARARTARHEIAAGCPKRWTRAYGTRSLGSAHYEIGQTTWRCREETHQHDCDEHQPDEGHARPR